MDTTEMSSLGVVLEAGDAITVRVQEVDGEKKLSFDATSGTAPDLVAAGSETKG